MFMEFGKVLLNAAFGLVLGLVIIFIVEFISKKNDDDDSPNIDDFRIYE